MLGFNALGRLALGQVEDAVQRPAFTAWSQPVKKSGLAAAVLATTVSGYAPQPPASTVTPPPNGGVFSSFSQPPPKIGISAYEQPSPAYRMFPIAGTPGPLVFSTFVERYTKPPRQNDPWVSFELTPPFKATFTGFYPFSQPLVRTTFVAQEQPNPLFEVRLTPPPPFIGFMDFGLPLQTKYTFANEQWNITVELNPPPVTPPAGGTSRKLPGHDERRKHKTGLEPVKKARQAPQVIEPAPIPLPPFKSVAEPTSSRPPLRPVDQAIPDDLMVLQNEILSAHDIADVTAHLLKLDQDDHDAQDIADVLAMLDLDPDLD